MTNRLLLKWQLRLFFAMSLIPCTLQLVAQCECGTPIQVPDPLCPGGFKQQCSGNLFTMNYCGPDTIYVGASCMGTLTSPATYVSVSGGNFSSLVEYVPPGGYPIGSNIPAGTQVTVHYIITSPTNVKDTLCFNLAFIDTISPVINIALASDTVGCELSDYAGWLQAQMDSLEAHKAGFDNCGVDTIYNNGPATFTATCDSVSVTFYVEDVSGNRDSISANYTITDSTLPTLIGVPADVIISCLDTIPAIATVTAMDNCYVGLMPSFSPSNSQSSDPSSCNHYDYTIIRSWTANDGCGNVVTESQTINIEDTGLPSFDIPADTMVNCGTPIDTLSLGSYSNAMDLCSSVLNVTMADVVTNGMCPQEKTIMRTWTIKDPCLNFTTKNQTITIRDTIPPTAVFPADITVDCDSVGNINITGVPTMVSDNCDTLAFFTQLPDTLVTGSCDHSYVLKRPWKIEDACGNDIQGLQIITVTDIINPVVGTQAQNQPIFCDDTVDADSVFNAWVSNNGGALATDNCTNTPDLTWVAYDAGTSTNASLAAPNCASPTPGIYRTRTVNFIVEDKCGNRDTTTATFTVADNTAPVLTNCPTDTLTSTDPGQCDALLTLALPEIVEECGNVVASQSFSLTEILTIPSGMDPVETPVNNVVFNFSVPGPPFIATSSATLKITLDNVDAEEPTEFFMVYGEDGSVLGPVAHTPTQCSDTMTTFTLTIAQVNAWAFDGVLTLTVKPNIPVGQPGRFSINPICPGGSVTADLNYMTEYPVNLKFEYSLNGGARNLVSPIAPVTETFGQGTTSVTYFFTDCAANETTCSFDVTVEDNEAPVIACPPNMSINLNSGVCTQDVLIPLFTNITDNCAVTTPAVQSQPLDSLDRLISFNYNPNLNDYVANDKSFTFTGLQGNATPGGVQLIITIQGDVDSVGAYFQIYDNAGNFLGTTANGQPNVTPGDCNTPSTATFTIPASTFNDWATAGDIHITAVSYFNYPIPPAGPGWGINPCNPAAVTADGDTDGSFIYATFSYQSVAPTFSATGATTISQVTLTPPLEAQTYTLNQGTTTFTYGTTDVAGNPGSCSFDVTLNDVELPVALCGPTFIDINPSGIVSQPILVSEIDLGSTDNCTIVSMTVTPSTVTCNDAQNNPNPVTLTVTDASGNVSTCNTFVNVTVLGPNPTVSSTCGSANLSLFANPPAASGGGSNPYQYVWKNPQGIPFAFVQNPVILDANQSNLGFYTVEIQGLTGCVAVQSVQVTCDLLPLQKPAIQAVDAAICSTENVQLTTPSVCGSIVIYKWYSGNAPGVLIGTTTVPNFSMAPPASGMFTFYVVVERNGCQSAPSDPITVTVEASPTAMPSPTSIILCEGEQILLNSINNANGTTCHWTGPCGFESFSCSPAPILNATLCNSGIYTLVTTKNGCPSNPATVAVTVVSQPAQPFISNSTSAGTPACQGATLTLTSTNVAGAVSFLWTTPTFTTISTSTNVLTIPSATIVQHAGTWTVQAIGNPCVSVVSPPVTVYIVLPPEAVSASATPTQVCEGQSVQLSATSASQNVGYFWVYPNGQTTAIQNPVVTNVNTNNSGIYNLIVTNEFGCSVTSSVEVSVINRVNITSVSSNAPPCAGGPVNVELVSTVFPANNGTYQYLWTGPNGYTSVNAIATIPNATFGNSGTYTLVVTNAQGCSSLPATLNVAIPQVLNTPNQPAGIVNPYCVGDAVTITTNPYPGPNVTYVWHTPSGDYTTSTPSLTLSNLTVTDAGPYTVNYSVGDCLSGTSSSNPLVVNPAPAVQIMSNSPVCEGQTLELSVNCTTGAIYEWTGPGGFSSTVCNPVIANANPALHAGTYTVRKKVGGCWSDIVSVNVTVNVKPAVPTAINAGPYCADSDNVMLSVTANSATPGATYTWYDTNGLPLGAATPSINFQVPNPTQYGNGPEEFFVVATLNGCNSSPSVPTVVTLNTIPGNQAIAGADIVGCQGDIITLSATVPTAGTGHWKLVNGNPAGVVIANPDQATTTVSGIVPGQDYVFQWSLSNGACTDYSSDEMSIYVDFLEQADAGDPITICYATAANLAAAMPASNDGVWTQPASQAALGVVIVNPANPATQVTNLTPGNSYVFTWTIDGGCGNSSDMLLLTVTNEQASASANGADAIIVCGDSTQLVAVPAIVQPNGQSNGYWSSPNGTINIITPSSAVTSVENLVPGQNILIWTIYGGACGQQSVDTLFVNYTIPLAGDDEINIPFATSGFTDILANDNLSNPDASTISIELQPAHGTVELGTGVAKHILTYTPDINFVGLDSAIYMVCQEGCTCATATVYFNVGKDAKCEVPSIITPNKDRMNDSFIIPCLAEDGAYPNNVLSIFNQWGDEVYHAEPYNNNWEGTFDGEDLPPSTYFYIIDLGNGEKPMSGYLIIQR
ncbi:MAG: gliding motility-associated C-terminal domain-containing protein [Saprospiraceae bacterium]|nr:gliding motility-associated C-terminal domain-containing protein [Saprospiraceae bacterium]MCF8250312.1 gliding motility-associated C-terminal domain-containing protein [Saprospiraceae bacterium]MCF8280963.1 gliding motility-associated C-terminal domain-containing protein [Bacteroidales bacterium]MCF8312056.1 gliding motility-associated C-terminal domain-containing protein [Saprospiraceae bacterium]MCF8440463.1 gliding motility-associated C-terminal domain-containing protein [Saprospiraceae 